MSFQRLHRRNGKYSEILFVSYPEIGEGVGRLIFKIFRAHRRGNRELEARDEFYTASRQQSALVDGTLRILLTFH